MWQIWKQLFLEILDYAAIRHKKIKPCKVPWLTSNIKKLIITRNKLKHKQLIANWRLIGKTIRKQEMIQILK